MDRLRAWLEALPICKLSDFFEPGRLIRGTIGHKDFIMLPEIINAVVQVLIQFSVDVVFSKMIGFISAIASPPSLL